MTVQSESKRRVYAALAAFIGCFALAVQFHLMLSYSSAEGHGFAFGVFRYFSFFTVWGNAFGAMCLASTALGAENFFARPSAQTAAAVYLVVVSVVYTLLLRNNLWSPDLEQRLANILLHYVMPTLYLLYWILFARKAPLSYRDAPLWLIYPATYVACMMLRGKLIDQYPYPFFNVDDLGYTRVVLNILGLGLAFLALGLAMIVLGKITAKTAR